MPRSTNRLRRHARQGVIEKADPSLGSEETQELLTEKIVKYTDGGKQYIPVNKDAYTELKSKGVPCVKPESLTTTEIGEKVMIPHSPVKALMSGVSVDDLTPVWQKQATPIALIEILLGSIGNPKNAPINKMYRAGDPPVATLTFTIPPQAPIGIIPQAAFLSATNAISDTKKPFKGQNVSFSVHESGQLEWAKGVNVYQFQDSRLTSGSIFEYPTDDDGKRILQSEPTGFTSTAEKRIAKVNEWAKDVDGLSVFISYKDIADNFTEALDNFDVVTHFDKVAGLNIDGLKYLVVFGYPKVKHDVVMDEARKQFASDQTLLPTGDYEELTQVDDYQENGITITERRYKDSRLEAIRLQLSIEKLEQAIGRARLPRWENTTTVVITNAVNSTTHRATLFTDAAFKIATSPSDLPDAADRITDAEKSGDVDAVMETTGVSQKTAYRRTQASRNDAKAERDAEIIRRADDGESKKQIATEMSIGQATVKRVLDAHENRGHQNCQDQLDILIGDDKNGDPPKNADDTSVQSENSRNGHHPIPRSEYSKLSETDARAELKQLDAKSDYAGANLLRQIMRNRGWQIPQKGDKP